MDTNQYAIELITYLCRNGSVTLHINIIKEAGLRSMRVKYKEENSLYCQNFCDVSLAMGLPTSSGFIKLKKKNTKY